MKQTSFFCSSLLMLSIVQSGILSWMNYHGVTWPLKVLCLHQVPQKYIPLELHHYLTDDLWKTPTSVDFGVSLQALRAPWALWPPHRGRTEGMLCEMDHEDSQADLRTCFLLFLILRYWKEVDRSIAPEEFPDSMISIPRSVVSRQERPTTSSSRVRQVPKASGGFRWHFFLLQFIRAHLLIEITFSKYMSTTQVQQH